MKTREIASGSSIDNEANELIFNEWESEFIIHN